MYYGFIFNFIIYNDILKRVFNNLYDYVISLKVTLAYYWLHNLK